MARRRISPQLRRQLAAAAGNACSYCRSPAIAGVPMAIDHIVPLAAGGDNDLPNLCLACYRCNEFKGALVEGSDPLTGVNTPLFHPRLQRWTEHFAWSEDGLRILGVTSTGRATIDTLKIDTLKMNGPWIQQARTIWILAGIHPPLE